jgi:hypothetical protein
MQRKVLYIAVMTCALLILIFNIAKSSSGGAPSGVCGAPDDLASNACGTSGCHNFIPITGSPSLKITMLDAVTNQEVTTWHVTRKYVVRVELTRASLNACGFESTVETKSGIHVGTYAAKLRCRYSPFSTTYMTHNSPYVSSKGYGKWEYYWTSPSSTSLGDVIIYAAGNAANGDGTNYGDSIFTTNKTFAFVNASGVDQSVLYSSRVSVFPNPVKDVFTISYELAKPSEVHTEIYNTTGQLIKNMENHYSDTGINEIRSDISNLPSGIYFVRLSAGNEIACQKIIKN